MTEAQMIAEVEGKLIDLSDVQPNRCDRRIVVSSPSAILVAYDDGEMEFYVSATYSKGRLATVTIHEGNMLSAKHHVLRV